MCRTQKHLWVFWIAWERRPNLLLQLSTSCGKASIWNLLQYLSITTCEVNQLYDAPCDSSVGSYTSFQPPPFLGHLQMQSSLDEHIFTLVTYETIPSCPRPGWHKFKLNQQIKACNQLHLQEALHRLLQWLVSWSQALRPSQKFCSFSPGLVTEFPYHSQSRSV